MSGPASDEGTLEELPSEGRRRSTHDDLHIVLECDRPLAGSTRHCIADVDQVALRRGPARRITRGHLVGARTLIIELPDSHMSANHATMRRLEGRWVLEDAHSRNGSYLRGRRIERAFLSEDSTFQLGHTYFLFRTKELPGSCVAGPLDVVTPAARDPALRTLSHELGAVLDQAVDASRSCLPVLFVGEAGSGKDTLARAVHNVVGDRSTFVEVGCALLGQGQGGDPRFAPAASDPRFALPGASDTVVVGLTEDCARAAGGTLYLNEIDRLGPIAQVALRAFLKSPARARVARIFSSVRSHDPRLELPRIPADLLAELAGFSVVVPPLRHRLEDVGMLVAEILTRIGAGGGRPPALRMDGVMGLSLLMHDWPYNISELDGCLRSALALSGGGPLRWSPPALAYGRTPLARSNAADPRYAPAPAGDSDAPAEAGDGAFSSTPEPEPAFSQGVRRALKCNLSVASLQKSELLRSHMVLEATGGSGAATSTVPALRAIVLDAIESLRRSSPRGAKQSRVLELTFIKPTATQHEAADMLGMAFGTYRRYVTSALAELTGVLWFRELSARSRRAGAGGSPGSAGDHDPEMLQSG